MDAPLIALTPAASEDAEFLRGFWPDLPAWSPVCQIFVATEQGIPIAAGRLDLQPISGTAEVAIAVLGTAQGRGVGTAVARQLVAEATALGYRWLSASLPEKDAPSRGAYAAAGFSIEQIQDGVVTMIREVFP